MRVTDIEARNFYELEAPSANWTRRALLENQLHQT